MRYAREIHGMSTLRRWLSMVYSADWHGFRQLAWQSATLMNLLRKRFRIPIPSSKEKSRFERKQLALRILGVFGQGFDCVALIASSDV
jgi:hypothetical protein